MKAAAETAAQVVEAEPEKDFERSEAAQAAGDVDKATRPISVIAPTLGASDISSTPEASPASPDPISHPAQIAREQIASGKPLSAEPAAPPARRRGQRVAAVARDVVEERLAPRVEKLRQASNVVWGEAQDDPNLRFILVALFLFIIALIVILLGTYIR